MARRSFAEEVAAQVVALLEARGMVPAAGGSPQERSAICSGDEDLECLDPTKSPVAAGELCSSRPTGRGLLQRARAKRMRSESSAKRKTD